MKFNVDIKSLIILILILVILFLKNCQSPNVVVEEKTITETVTEIKTVEVEKEVYVPKYTERIITNIDTVLVQNPIDTLEILKDYYTRYLYSDTLQLDTLGYVIINDTITMNKILSREFSSTLSIPETTIKETIYLNSRLFFIGPNISFTGTGFDGAHLDFYYKDRGNRLYNIGLGVNDRGDALFNTGIKFEIK